MVLGFQREVRNGVRDVRSLLYETAKEVDGAIDSRRHRGRMGCGAQECGWVEAEQGSGGQRIGDI